MRSLKPKYYTPDIEEFHVGFECQGFVSLVDGSGWSELEVDEALLRNILDPDPAKNIYDEFQVKYLDMQDILDLGFELVDEIDDNGDMSFQWIENSDLWLTFDKEKIAIGDANGTLFYGKVENKSELKRVIKQVTT